MANWYLVFIALFNVISPNFGACPPGFIAYDGDIPGTGLFSEYIASFDKCAHDCKEASGCGSFSHSLIHNGCKLMYGFRPTGPKSGDYQFCSNLGCTDTHSSSYCLAGKRVGKCESDEEFRDNCIAACGFCKCTSDRHCSEGQACGYPENYYCCADNPNGYDGYGCQDYQYYCDGYSGTWYDNFRAACKTTCNSCEHEISFYCGSGLSAQDCSQCQTKHGQCDGDCMLTGPDTCEIREHCGSHTDCTTDQYCDFKTGKCAFILGTCIDRLPRAFNLTQDCGFWSRNNCNDDIPNYGNGTTGKFKDYCKRSCRNCECENNEDCPIELRHCVQGYCNACFEDSDCKHGGTCTNGKCVCTKEFDGIHCEKCHEPKSFCKSTFKDSKLYIRAYCNVSSEYRSKCLISDHQDHLSELSTFRIIPDDTCEKDKLPTRLRNCPSKKTCIAGECKECGKDYQCLNGGECYKGVGCICHGKFDGPFCERGCFDEPNGHKGYDCRKYDYYCNYTGDWYEQFRGSCRRTCNTCNGPTFRCPIEFPYLERYGYWKWHGDLCRKSKSDRSGEYGCPDGCVPSSTGPPWCKQIGTNIPCRLPYSMERFLKLSGNEIEYIDY